MSAKKNPVDVVPKVPEDDSPLIFALVIERKTGRMTISNNSRGREDLTKLYQGLRVLEEQIVMELAGAGSQEPVVPKDS